VTGILKTFLRELPEALFTDQLYPRFFDTFSAFSNNNESTRINELLKVFEELPQVNKASINSILDHQGGQRQRGRRWSHLFFVRGQ